jgi:hypothetical protein
MSATSSRKKNATISSKPQDMKPIERNPLTTSLNTCLRSKPQAQAGGANGVVTNNPSELRYPSHFPWLAPPAPKRPCPGFSNKPPRTSLLLPLCFHDGERCCSGSRAISEKRGAGVCRQRSSDILLPAQLRDPSGDDRCGPGGAVQQCFQLAV